MRERRREREATQCFGCTESRHRFSSLHLCPAAAQSVMRTACAFLHDRLRANDFFLHLCPAAPSDEYAAQFDIHVTRARLQDRFGVTAPIPQKPREATKRKGRIVTRKNSSPSILPAGVRGDPHAAPPRLTQKDVARGMEELVNRGMIPKHIDLTPAFVKMPAPVLCGQSRPHRRARAPSCRSSTCFAKT